MDDPNVTMLDEIEDEDDVMAAPEENLDAIEEEEEIEEGVEEEEEAPAGPSRDEQLAELKSQIDRLSREKEEEEAYRRAAASRGAQEDWRKNLDEADNQFLEYFEDRIKAGKPHEAIQALRNAARYESAVIAQQIAEQTVQHAFGAVFTPAMSREEFLSVAELSDIHDLVDEAMSLDQLGMDRVQIIRHLRGMKTKVTGKRGTENPKDTVSASKPRQVESPRPAGARAGKRRTNEKDLKESMRGAWKKTFGID